MTKQEVINQVSQQLEQADFTPVMTSLLRQSTTAVLNRAKQNLDATLQENTNPQIQSVLNQVNNEVTNATTEWIDSTTGQLVVFPEGTRYVSKDSNNLIVVVEEKPHVRSINFKYLDNNNNQIRSTYSISLPYIYFIAIFNGSHYAFRELKMCCSKNPITSLNSSVFALPLPNVHGTHLICTGSMNVNEENVTVIQKMNAVINSYWSSEFNTDLTQFLIDFLRINSIVTDPIQRNTQIAAGFLRWQQLSQQNPMWAIQPQTQYSRNFAISTLIPVDNSSRTSRTAVINRVKQNISTNINNLGENIIQTVRNFNITDENRDRPHIDTLKSLYNRVITSAYDNLWNPIMAAHEAQKQTDLQSINNDKQAIQRQQRELEQVRQRNESALNRDRQAFEAEKTRWLQEKTARENQLAITHQYLQRKLSEIGDNITSATPVAATPAATPVATPVATPTPVVTIPNPPGFTGRGRRRLEPWTIGSIYRKRQADGSYIVHVWNGFNWIRQ